MICPVPLFHVTATHHIFLSSFSTGRKCVLMPKWDAGEALRLIETERPNGWTGVPTMVQDLMQHPDFLKRDTSSLTNVGAGGAPTPKSQVFQVGTKFKAAGPTQGYGLTETNAGIAIISGDTYVLKPGSTGQPFPCVEVKIVDLDTGKEVKAGARGEVCIRSPQLFKEYWNKPKATAEVMTPDGWFKSGDVGLLDNEGFLYIVDRAKDIIIRGGENISCAEVESAFFHHPTVQEVAVFGMPDERLGERTAAMIMFKEGKNASPAELVESVRTHLAPFKIPRPEDVFFSREPLPRGATGKTQKRDIKARVLKELQEKPRSKL